MTSPSVPFIWYELMTDDADAVTVFYRAVVGWTIQPAQPGAPLDYRMITRSDGGGQGGVLQLSPEMQAEGAHPAWVPYLHAADIDGAIAAILADGGRQIAPRMDIAEGSFAMVTDPLGTPFYLMQPNPPADRPDARSDVFDVVQPQHVRWNELASPDPESAKAFYARHFGLRFEQVLPMGAMGDYCFMEHAAITLGAIMAHHPGSPPPLWTVYFGVPDIDAACAAVTANGGTMLRGPDPAAGVDFSAVARDLRGAVFGLVGPRGAA